MFNLWKKKMDSGAERHPLNLPEIPEEKMNSADIVKMLSAGIPIWTWCSLMDKYNVSALTNIRGNCEDGFAMFRKEEDLLVKYVGNISSDQKMVMEIAEVSLFKASNVLELFETELKDAYKVYYDEDHLTEDLLYYCYDVTYEDMKEFLKTHRVMSISKDHFIRKDSAS